uniref:Transmembrane protein n=1 Tax=Panagrellus redivivus TaxID=6233 RepID=A0A7E5A0D2_PANRE
MDGFWIAEKVASVIGVVSFGINGAVNTCLIKRVYYTDVESTFASNSSFTAYKLMYLALEAIHKLQLVSYRNCKVFGSLAVAEI